MNENEERRNRLRMIEAYIKESCTLDFTAQGDPYTLVAITGLYEGREYTASGIAECGPHDEWNESRGIQIAKGRAIKRLSKAIEERTWRYRDRHTHCYITDMGDMACEMSKAGESFDEAEKRVREEHSWTDSEETEIRQLFRDAANAMMEKMAESSQSFVRAMQSRTVER